MIPQSCVLFRNSRTEVFVVSEGNRASLRVLRLGRTEGEYVNILGGLSPGDRLVISGGQSSLPSTPVLPPVIEIHF